MVFAARHCNSHRCRLFSHDQRRNLQVSSHATPNGDINGEALACSSAAPVWKSSVVQLFVRSKVVQVVTMIMIGDASLRPLNFRSCVLH